MTAWLERLLRHGAGQVSPSRREWAAAALSELQAIDGRGARALWALGTASMIVRDLLEQSFLPWRLDPRQRPPSGFAAVLGLALLAGPAWFAARSGVAGIAWNALAGVAVMLALWSNAAMVLRPQPLGGLVYALGIRLLPANITVAALAIGIGAALL